MTGRGGDPLRADLDLAYSRYIQMAARVAPGQGASGRRVPPGSRPPVDLRMVSEMDAFRMEVAAFINRAGWLLEPWTKVDLTARTGARCPYCNGDLTGWLSPRNDSASEIICDNQNHPVAEGPNRWAKRDWPRLGVLTGVHIDARYGAQLPDLPHAVGEA